MQFTKLKTAITMYLSDSSGTTRCSQSAVSALTKASSFALRVSLDVLLQCTIAKSPEQVVTEVNCGDEASHLMLLFVLGDERPGQTRFLHRLEANEQEIDQEIRVTRDPAHGSRLLRSAGMNGIIPFS